MPPAQATLSDRSVCLARLSCPSRAARNRWPIRRQPQDRPGPRHEKAEASSAEPPARPHGTRLSRPRPRAMGFCRRGSPRAHTSSRPPAPRHPVQPPVPLHGACRSCPRTAKLPEPRRLVRPDSPSPTARLSIQTSEPSQASSMVSTHHSDGDRGHGGAGSLACFETSAHRLQSRRRTRLLTLPAPLPARSEVGFS